MKTFILLILMCIIKGGHAQSLSGKIYYRQILNLDSMSYTKNQQGKRAILYFTDSLSYYVYNSTTTAKADKLFYQDDANNTFDISYADDIGEVFMTDYRKRQVTIREFVWKKPFMTVDSLTVMRWQLTGDEKRIGRFTCQKAITSFKGREYQAWFTTEIPVSVGPWKLHGLPGLILEAYDQDMEVHYVFDSIEIPNKEIFSVKKPTKGKLVSLSAYRQLWPEETKKLKLFLESTAEKGVSVQVNIAHFPIERSDE